MKEIKCWYKYQFKIMMYNMYISHASLLRQLILNCILNDTLSYDNLFKHLNKAIHI